MYQVFINVLKSRFLLMLIVLLGCAVLGLLLLSVYLQETVPVVPAPQATSAASSNLGPVVLIDPLATIEEGKHYQRYPAKIVTESTVQNLIAESPGKIQVIEFFNYGCFWCQRLHPMVNEWLKKKPENVAFYRFPVVFQKNWEVLAKAYFVTKHLGKNDSLDAEFFTALNEKHIDLSDENLLQAFFVKHGVPKEKFLELYGSFGVNQELAKSQEISNAYQIVLSPVIVVNAPSGSYLLNSTFAGSEQGLFTVLDYLITQESKQDSKQ